MDNFLLSLFLAIIVLSLWVLPNVYAVAGTLLLAIYASYLDQINFSSVIIIFILSFSGYHFIQRNGDKSTVLRIILLMLVFWALFSEDYEGKILRFSGQLEILKTHQQFIINLNFEKILAAILLAAYQLNPQFSLKYWKKVFASGWSILFLVYIALLLPLIILLHILMDLNISNIHLATLLLNAFLVSFAEEVLFRGILQNWLTQIVRIKIGPSASWIAILLVSIIYGLFHAKFGIFIIFFSCFVGGAYGYIYRKSGKIEVPILMHFAISLTFCLVLAFYGHGDLLPVIVY